MNQRRSLKTAVPIMLLIMLLLGCARATPIKQILDDPRAYTEKPVTIAGEVTQVTSLFFLQYFVVRDNTGEITVVTGRPLPKEGQKIRVTGNVREAFSIGAKQFIVIVESEPKKPS